MAKSFVGLCVMATLFSTYCATKPKLRLCRSDEPACDESFAFLDRGDLNFWKESYQVTWKHFQRPTQPDFFFESLGMDTPKFSTTHTIIEALADGWSHDSIGTIEMRDSTGRLRKANATSKKLNSSISTSLALACGDSFVIRLENMAEKLLRTPTLAPLFVSMGETTKLTGHISHGHVYITASRGATALKPHTDPYDVFVHQILGSKTWTMCAPALEGEAAMFDLSRADRCLHRDVVIKSSSLHMEELIEMDCETIILRAGDSLYLPKGTIHFAVSSDTSVHYTGSLIRDGVEWRDFFTFVAGLTMCSDQQDCRDDVDRVLEMIQASAFGFYIRKTLPYLREIVQDKLSTEQLQSLFDEASGRVLLCSSALKQMFGDDLSSAPRFVASWARLSTLDLKPLLVQHCQHIALKTAKRLADPMAYVEELAKINNKMILDGAERLSL
eukprot:m.119293 g.119293  ORF g.119293 m.119293 type:complete len:443 (-) comp28722_c0_seq1:81-1409(-)